MKGICLLLVVLVCVSAHTVVDQEWEDFKTKFDKTYTQEEELHRHEVFRENKKLVDEHNILYKEGKSTFFMGVNKFSDLHGSETGFLRGAKRPDEDLKIKGAKLYKPKGVSVPDYVDWTTQGYVTGVKDQGQCGSCWAFSTTGSLEGQHFRFTGALISLSEQNLVDCVSTNAGCNGGWMDYAFEYIRDNGGIDTEDSYGYEAADGTCRYNAGNIGATVTGFVDIASGDETALKEACGTEGPISVTIDASWPSFQGYAGGVYYEPQCTTTNLDHAVLVAGYGTDNGTPYWLVKNSWGQGWGSGGYILMSRDNGNNCGIASVASYPTV